MKVIVISYSRTGKCYNSQQQRNVLYHLLQYRPDLAQQYTILLVNQAALVLLVMSHLGPPHTDSDDQQHFFSPVVF